MPTSTRQDAPYFTGIFGEFATSQRADVGIGPYRIAANSYCFADFERRAFLLQQSKRTYLQIRCTVTGGAYHSARRDLIIDACQKRIRRMHQLRPSALFSPIFSRARKKDWAAEGASETASTERVLAVREASYPLSLFPPFQSANAPLVCTLAVRPRRNKPPRCAAA